MPVLAMLLLVAAFVPAALRAEVYLRFLVKRLILFDFRRLLKVLRRRVLLQFVLPFRLLRPPRQDAFWRQDTRRLIFEVRQILGMTSATDAAIIGRNPIFVWGLFAGIW